MGRGGNLLYGDLIPVATGDGFSEIKTVPAASLFNIENTNIGKLIAQAIRRKDHLDLRTIFDDDLPQSNSIFEGSKAPNVDSGKRFSLNNNVLYYTWSGNRRVYFKARDIPKAMMPTDPKLDANSIVREDRYSVSGASVNPQRFLYNIVKCWQERSFPNQKIDSWKVTSDFLKDSRIAPNLVGHPDNYWFRSKDLIAVEKDFNEQGEWFLFQASNQPYIPATPILLYTDAEGTSLRAIVLGVSGKYMNYKRVGAV